jgi:hypothetical protein
LRCHVLSHHMQSTLGGGVSKCGLRWRTKTIYVKGEQRQWVSDASINRLTEMVLPILPMLMIREGFSIVALAFSKGKHLLSQKGKMRITECFFGREKRATYFWVSVKIRVKLRLRTFSNISLG